MFFISVTYGDVRKRVLQLIDEYSSRGSVITAASKIGDIKFKIQGQVDIAQFDLAKTKARIPAVYTFERTLKTDATEYDVPTDLLDFNYITMKYDDSENYIYNPGLYSKPTGKIIVREELYPATFEFHYFKRPSLLTFTNTDADDDLTFEISDEAALIMPEFIAGKILISEGDSVKGGIYLNLYYDAKSELPGPFYNTGPTIVNNSWW